MTRIRILRRFNISPDGLRVVTWAEGSEHDVSEGVLDMLIGEGACEIIEAKAFADAPENKAMVTRGRGRPRKGE